MDLRMKQKFLCYSSVGEKYHSSLTHSNIQQYTVFAMQNEAILTNQQANVQQCSAMGENYCMKLARAMKQLGRKCPIVVRNFHQAINQIPCFVLLTLFTSTTFSLYTVDNHLNYQSFTQGKLTDNLRTLTLYLDCLPAYNYQENFRWFSTFTLMYFFQEP